MRAVLALGLLLAAGVTLSSAYAQSDRALQTPCRSFVASMERRPYRGSVGEAVKRFVDARDGLGHTLASECVILEMARAECIAHPRLTLIDVLESILAKDRANAPLPEGRRCGA